MPKIIVYCKTTKYMEKFLFSKKNIDNLCEKVLKVTKIQPTQKNVQFCRSIIANRMKKLYEMTISKKPKTMSPKDYAERLCKTTIRDCVIALKRSQASAMENKSDQISGNVAEQGCNYQNIMSGNGEYITATGEMGGKMEFRDDRNMKLQEKPSSEDLENKMYERQLQYDSRGGSGGSFDRRDINFSLDDDTTMRRRNDGNMGNNNMGMGNNQMQQQNDPSQYFQGFSGFGSGLEQGGLADIGMIGVNPNKQLDDVNTSAALSRLESERASLDSFLSSQRPPQKFNPMNNPNQMNQQQQQYNPNQFNQQQQQPQQQQYNPNQFNQQQQYNPNQFNQQQNMNQYRQQPQQQQYNPNQFNQQHQQQQQYNPNQFNQQYNPNAFPQQPPMVNKKGDFF